MMKTTYDDLVNFLEVECGSLCMDDEDDRGVLASAILNRFIVQHDDDELDVDDDDDTQEDYLEVGSN